MTPAVVFVTGRDPEQAQVCSHTSYVRTHARAAVQAGYDAHVLCLAREARTQATDYGSVTAAPTGFSMVRQNMISSHSPALAQALAQLVRSLGRREVILHGFGVWGHAVIQADARLRESGGPGCPRLLGSYTTYLDESESQWRGLSPADGPRAYARFALEQAWIRSVVVGYERRAYRGADLVLVNYRAVQRLIEARFGAVVRCRVVPYTIEQALMQSAEAPPRRQAGDRPPTILCIARHDPRKGVDVLLRALAILARAGLQFRAQLVGAEGALLDAHRRLAAALGLAGLVDIPGRVPSVDAYLAEADIFVLPSREEQSGSLALIEAMQAGVACVATACDGIPEDVRDGEDALLAPPDDAPGLARQIATLVTDPARRAQLALAARRVFETRFSPQGFVAALDAVYQDALARDAACA